MTILVLMQKKKKNASDKGKRNTPALVKELLYKTGKKSYHMNIDHRLNVTWRN